MKKKKITYGVSGMMEFQAVIKVGRNIMKVPFADGSMSAMGVNPAKFTTTNFMVQHAIENSAEFKRGLIKVYDVIELDEELKIERNSNNTEAEADDTELHARSGESGAESFYASDIRSEQGKGTILEPTLEPEARSQGGEAGEAARIDVEFSVNDDAKDYLEQNFGAVRSKLRSRADILAFAEAHGVDIKFI